MAQWNSSESGILRKNRKKDNFEDLLVFGYACKVFRDDDKALHIDQGKHLIPWMGDQKLKIDRYDCRGHLSDIRQYESSREGFDAMRWLGLNDSERRIEQLCDDERYYSLQINEEDEEMYKEEELKRNKTNEFQYSYDVPMNPDAKEEAPTVPENEEDEKYVPPPDLDVPVDIAMPTTVKESARIEKTAMFVSSQGPQMEILIKAKQSDNPQFSFLNQNDPLYKFYRHVLNAFKTGRYQSRTGKSDQNATNAASGGDSGDHYLHPSLVSSSTSSTEVPLPTIPSVPYRPSANCAYSQLVTRIQGQSNIGGGTPPPQGQPIDPIKEQQGVATGATDGAVHNMGNLTYEQQQQYYQYYMQQQYYEYYKQMAQKSGVGDEVPPRQDATPMDPNLQAYIQQMMYAQYFQQSQVAQQPSNPYAQIVSNVNKEMPNPYPIPETPDISREPVIYGATQQAPPTAPEKAVPAIQATPTPNEDGARVPENVADSKKSPKKPSLLSLIQNYGTDSEDESSEDEEEPEDDYKIPEGEAKVVIDKMACYVVKNGADFENIVKSRADPRFVFLNDDHEFHRYYRKQVNEEWRKKKEVEGVKEGGKETREVVKIAANKVKEKKVIAPVSFSIKKPKEEPPKEIKSALPIDEETDEEEETEQEVAPPPPMISQPQTLVNSNPCKIVFHRIETPSTPSKDKEKDIKQPSKEREIKQLLKDREKDAKQSSKEKEKEIKQSSKEKEKEIKQPSKEKEKEMKRTDKEIKDHNVTKEIEEERTVTKEKEDNKKELKKSEEIRIVTNENIVATSVFDLKKVADRFRKNGRLDKDDPILEMIDLTEDVNGTSKKDEDIFDLTDDKDKSGKDNRALQLERRKKAMAFLKLKSVTPKSGAQATDGATTTIPTIDLSNVKSPRGRTMSVDSSSLDEEEDRRKMRERSRTKDRDLSEEPKSKRPRESEQTVSRKEREKSRKCRSPRGEKKYETREFGELEEGEMSEEADDYKHKKSSSHKKKKSHKRKHSKSKHSSKSKKKSKKKEIKSPCPTSSDSDESCVS